MTFSSLFAACPNSPQLVPGCAVQGTAAVVLHLQIVAVVQHLQTAPVAHFIRLPRLLVGGMRPQPPDNRHFQAQDKQLLLNVPFRHTLQLHGSSLTWTWPDPLCTAHLAKLPQLELVLAGAL